MTTNNTLAKDNNVPSKTLTEQWKQGDVCIGTIDNKKIYLMWQDVKDICNDEVKKENAKLKELLKDLRELIGNNFVNYEMRMLLTQIDEVLK